MFISKTTSCSQGIFKTIGKVIACRIYSRQAFCVSLNPIGILSGIGVYINSSVFGIIIGLPGFIIRLPGFIIGLIGFIIGLISFIIRLIGFIIGYPALLSVIRHYYRLSGIIIGYPALLSGSIGTPLKNSKKRPLPTRVRAQPLQLIHQYRTSRFSSDLQPFPRSAHRNNGHRAPAKSKRSALQAPHPSHRS